MVNKIKNVMSSYVKWGKILKVYWFLKNVLIGIC